MADIQLHMTQERLDALTVDDQIALEEWSDGDAATRQMRDVIARFVVDGDKKYLSEARARRLIGHLTMGEFGAVIREFTRGLANMAANPTNGGD